MLAGQEMENKSQFISMFTEPYTVKNKLVGMPTGLTSVYDRTIRPDSPPPRAAIAASRDLKVTALDTLCHRDCAAALAKIHGRQTLLLSVYRDITKPVIEHWMTEILDMATNKGYPVLLCMDTNAHSEMFGPETNARGEALEDFLLEQGLFIENIGNTPTFETRRHSTFATSFIDLTASRDLHFTINDWHVDRSYNASDHNTIKFLAARTETEKVGIRPWSKADWHLFSDTLRQADYKIPEAMSMKKLDRLVQRMYSLLETALDAACPIITRESVVHKNHSSTDKHAIEKKKVSELYHRAKSSQKEDDWARYRLADKQFKKMCKTDRNKAWRKFKEALQSEKEMAALARLAQREERREINTLSKPDGSSTAPGEETIEYLAKTHFPAATTTRHVTYNNRRNLPLPDIQAKYKDWINTALISKALAGFEKKKSPGPDGIKPIIFEHLPPQFIALLETVYKSCIHLGYTPKAWKRTKVIFISKPGKDSYDKPKSFRPISLSNYFLKGLERLVGWNMDLSLIHI